MPTKESNTFKRSIVLKENTVVKCHICC
ncbi:hypothetical protein [Maribacter confluentis]